MTYSLVIRDIVENSTRRSVHVVDGRCVHCKTAVGFQEAYGHECASNPRTLITVNGVQTHPGVKGTKV